MREDRRGAVRHGRAVAVVAGVVAMAAAGCAQSVDAGSAGSEPASAVAPRAGDGAAGSGDTAHTAGLTVRPVLDQARADQDGAGQDGTARPPALTERQSTDPARQQQVMRAMAATGCSGGRVPGGRDDPSRPLVACYPDLEQALLLGPAVLTGQDIGSAQAHVDAQMGSSVVALEFTPDGGEVWSRYTGEHIGEQAAFVLDGAVLSAPLIQGATPAGSATSIYGDFSHDEARDLARRLDQG